MSSVVEISELVANGVTKSYGAARILSDITFDLRAREIVGIIGPNGAGKTTLLECLAGLLPVDNGEVHVRGRAVPSLWRRDSVFYLPDGVTPWSDQMVWRQTALFRRLFDRSLAEEREIVARLELTPVLGNPAGELSKGYRRRLLLALALLSSQPILLLDEPFDGLDLRQTLQVCELLREVSGSRSLVLSIHQLQDAARVCDRFLLLAGGRLLGFGTLPELADVARVPEFDLEKIFLALTN